MVRHAVMSRQICRLVPFETKNNTDLLVSAEFVWHEKGLIELSYGFRSRGELGLSELVMPAPARVPQRRDELWETTCFEAFFSVPEEEKYWELNVSPSGDWNFYSLESYRSGLRPVMEMKPPEINIEVRHKDCRCDVLLDLDPWWTADQAPEFSLTAVVQRSGASMSYWAMKHMGDVADFHDRRSFLPS
jgi:hypothetical protein